METIKQFLADHKLSAHSFAAIWGIADVLWYTNTEFHAYVSGLLMTLPAWLHAFIFGIVVPGLVYWKATRKPGDKSTSPNKLVMLVLFGLLMSPALLLNGCVRGPVNAAPVSTVQRASIIYNDMTAIVKAAQISETAAYNKQLVSVDTHRAFSEGFVVVAQKESALGVLLAAGASSADVRAAVISLTAAIRDGISSGAYNVKDPGAQSQLTALVSTVGVLTSQLLAAYGG